MADRLALIIANSEFNDSTLTRLATPSRDAEALAQVLGDPDIGAFDVTVLLDKPDREVRRAIQRLFREKTRDDLLLLYYSGHGLKDERGELYLAAHDTEKALFESTAVSSAFVARQLDRSNSQRKVVVLDCCYSGAFVPGTMAEEVLGSSAGVIEAFEGTGYGRVILTATSSIEYAWEGDQLLGEIETSVFTRFLVEGLQTGKADLNGDGRVTPQELYDYVFKQVVTSGYSQQTPRYWAQVEGEIIIARSTFAKRQRELEQLYREAKAKLDSGLWAEAKDLFERIETLEPGYRDVSGLLSTAREREAQLSQLYTEAQQLSEAGEWQAVLTIFEQMADIGDYSDREGLLLKAQREVAELKRQAELDEGYIRAVAEYTAKRWSEARQLLAQIQAMQPGYREVERLLARTEAEIAEEEAQRQTQRQTAKLYRRALWMARARQWQKALDELGKIKDLDPRFADRKGIEARARAAVRAREDAQRRQARGWKKWTSRVPRWTWALVALVLLALVLALWTMKQQRSGLFSPTPTATTTPTVAPTNTPTDTPTIPFTATNTRSPSRTPTATRMPTTTPSHTPTPPRTPTATLKPTTTSRRTPTPTPTPTATYTPTRTGSSTPTWTSTATPTPTATSPPPPRTNTPKPSPTYTPTEPVLPPTYTPTEPVLPPTHTPTPNQ